MKGDGSAWPARLAADGVEETSPVPFPCVRSGEPVGSTLIPDAWPHANVTATLAAISNQTLSVDEFMNTSLHQADGLTLL